MFGRVCRLFILVSFLLFAPAANAFVYGFEEKLVPIKELPADVGAGWSVGYYVRSAHVLFVPVFQWGGEVCIYQGDRYLKVDEMDPEMRKLYDELAGYVSIPVWYRLRLGNLIVPGALLLILGLGWKQRKDQISSETRLMEMVESDKALMARSAQPDAPEQKFELPVKPLSLGPARSWMAPRDFPNNALANLPSTIFRGPGKQWKLLGFCIFMVLVCLGLMIGTMDSDDATGVGAAYFALWISLVGTLFISGQRAAARFEDGRVIYDGRALFLTDQWSEPLENYDGIRVSPIPGSKSGECTVILAHPVEARSLTLFQGKSPLDLATESKRLAQLLGVKALG